MGVDISSPLAAHAETVKRGLNAAAKLMAEFARQNRCSWCGRDGAQKRCDGCGGPNEVPLPLMTERLIYG